MPNRTATIQTNKGTIKFELLEDDAPKTTENFRLLAEKGYTGYLSYEAPNPEQWARSPYDVAREGVELTRKLLRDAVPDYVT